MNKEKNKSIFFFNLIKIRSTHLLPIFYQFFLPRATKKKTIENREQVHTSDQKKTDRKWGASV